MIHEYWTENWVNIANKSKTSYKVEELLDHVQIAPEATSCTLLTFNSVPKGRLKRSKQN